MLARRSTWKLIDSFISPPAALRDGLGDAMR